MSGRKKKKSVTKQDLCRIGCFSIEEVFSKISDCKEKTEFVTRDGIKFFVKMDSPRYRVFKEKGLQCASCKLVGEYFAAECHRLDLDTNVYHFNLYAKNKYGQEVLMTKDHIVPKSKGGENNLNNYQTMCFLCNLTKADKSYG